MDDFRFEELRVQIYPQSGADGIITAEDIEADLADVPAIDDKGGSSLITAGRPQPPPTVDLGAIDIRSISNCIIGRLALSCAIGAEILICFGNA